MVGNASTLVAITLSSVVLCGCALPKQFQVRNGAEPRYEDTDVMFRTTYYFRVVDICEPARGPTDAETIAQRFPIQDSLYRFRMTGKARATTNKVRFESGSLRAAEIDPFGSSIEYDANGGGFRYVSQARTRQREDERAVVRQLDEVRALLSQKWDGKEPPSKEKLESLSKNLVDKLATVYEASGTGPATDMVSNATRSGPPRGASDYGAQGPVGGGEGGLVDVRCSGGTTRRGFAILGPEGWRTFDQDERLVLAMSSSGQPLVDVLKELSARSLGERPSEEADMEVLRAQTAALRGKAYLRASANLPVADSIRAAIEAIEKYGSDRRGAEGALR